jgi:hypothetical protein
MLTPKIIHHPLRDISLAYDETKEELPYEKNLLADYLTLHDYAVELKNKFIPLPDLEKKHHVTIDEVELLFAPVEKKINEFHLLSRNFQSTQEIKRSVFTPFVKRAAVFNDDVQEFHEHADHMGKEAKEVEAANEAYDKIDDVFTTFLEKFTGETTEDLYKNYDLYSLDLCAYDDDKENFLGYLPRTEEFDRMHNKIFDQYEALVKRINESYAKWNELNYIIEEIANKEFLADTSLSESFKNTGDAPAEGKPLYLISPGDERIEDFREEFERFANILTDTIDVSVPQETVEENDAGYFQDMIVALQHYPLLIEKALFAVRIEFEKIPGSDLTLSEDEWKGIPEFMKWFRNLNRLPIVLFFLQDHDARFYALMGDYSEDEKLKVEVFEDKKDQRVTVEGEMFQDISNRLFESCWFLLMYCHNTGFDPEPYIESVIADYNMTFTFEMVKKRFEEDITKGIQFRWKSEDE